MRSRAWASGVRMRAALVAVIVVALALTAGAGLLLVLLRHSLIDSVRTAAKARAVEVSRLVETEGVGGLSTDLAGAGPPGQVVQVIGPKDAVAATSLARAQTPLSALRAAPGQVAVASTAVLPTLDHDARYLVVARGVSTSGASYVVLVAAGVDAQLETVSTVRSYLALGFPLLLVVVGIATFLLVGRSLRPVEQIRRRVAGIGAQELTERVPVPASGDEIARLAVTMNAMLDRLQAARDSQHRFVADASHELRSPLATLRASLDVAAADPDGTSWLELHPTMDAETIRMGGLVEDLLLLAKADEDGLRLEVAEVDLDDLIGSEVRRLRAATALTVSAEIVPARVDGDPDKLAQALRNLTENAARHTTSRIHLALRVEDRWAIVHVDDDGPGVPEADRARVFDRFVRLDSSRERSSGGSGLGLAIVQEIAVGHGGSVSAGESPWGGARFTLRLPLTPTVPPEPRTAP
jgi:signal transduction histidine kinase